MLKRLIDVLTITIVLSSVIIDSIYCNNYIYHNNKVKFTVILILLTISIFILNIFYKNKIPSIKKRITKKNIRYDVNHNNYFLKYQPIINPRNNQIIGFEGLLRLKKDDKILTPCFFINDIEDNDMLFEISLHILKLAIKDYYILENYDNLKNCDFYISLNMSLTEIENDTFVKKMCEIANNMNMKKNSICIEILENVKIKDLNKINNTLEYLKNSGFIIAIDDFGVEYSNLDILEKLPFDIIKIDKYFIDKLGNSMFIKDIITFLSSICKSKNKYLVCEGVEHKFQKEFIEGIENDKLYIQGFYYFKPLNLNEINKIKL